MSKRELVILGTSAQQPTRFRNHGAYLLWWQGEGLLFDPGEGTQRQFIFANIAPTVVTRIFISHFHGDHCLGLGSMLLRLNLDKVQHVIHCYYPAKGKKYFDRLRYSTIYREQIRVEEHPVSQEGLVHEDKNFTISAAFLDHGVPNIAWRIQERNERKFDKEKLEEKAIRGALVRQLEQEKELIVEGERVMLNDVSWVREGSIFSYVMDTRYCQNAVDIAQNATLLLCEATYCQKEARLAKKHYHLTAQQAGEIAARAKAKALILTHFSARYPSVQPLLREAKKTFPNTFAAKEMAVFPLKKENAPQSNSPILCR